MLIAALVMLALAAEEGFRPLFDGRTLEGWMLTGKRGPGYLVEDGQIVCPTGGASGSV